MTDPRVDWAPSPVRTGRIRAKLQRVRVLIKARLEVATGRLAHDRVFGHLDDDVWFSVNTTAYRRYAMLQQVLPSLPDAQTQKNFIGSEGDTALGEAFRVYQVIRRIADRFGRPVTRETRILDFGCGWGRTIRFFMRDAPIAQLHGVDVMPLAIDLSRKTNPWCRFSLVPALPPSGLPGGAFDLIYLYSVFSHLSEDAHDRWITEFQRLLSPRGLLFATTWHRNYIERCESARRGNPMGTHPGSLRAFQGTEAWLARYDRGEYCHSPVGGGSALSSEFYGESCISEAYVRRRWSDRFDVREYIEADGEWLHQNLIVAQRR
jgi:SAM-dependent methyltransferase